MKMCFLMVADVAVVVAAAFVAVFVIYSSASCVFHVRSTHTHKHTHIASGFFIFFYLFVVYFTQIKIN